MIRVIQIAAIVVTLAPASPLDRATVQLTYLGTAGWEIADGQTTILIDPYLSRLRHTTPNDDVMPGDTRPLFTATDVVQSDAAVIDAHIQRADCILVTHTHGDHALDVPYIARKTGAMVIGTESTLNVARAYGITNDKLLLGRGGDDLEFGTWSVRVIPSLHGILRRAPFLRRDPNALPPSTVVPADVKAPLRWNQFVEGGTLAYLIRIGGRQVLAFGSMNYIEREVDGLRPDVALIGAMPERREIHEYTSRLLRAIGYPRMVLPTHWDRFNVTYDISQAPALERLQSFVAEVKAASPRTVVRIPRYFEPVEIR
jgi:L-ascorbate metabolism protein UlaG (beta-lactamase superfamily)